MPLQHISSISTFSHCFRALDIWNQIISFEKYAGFILEIDEIKILSDNKSEWYLTLDNAPFSWVEADLFNKESYTLNFNSISGDFENFQGSWKIVKDSLCNNQLKIDIDYCLGIPVIEDLINNVLKEKMQRFADSMIKAHSDMIQLNFKDTRTSTRFRIGKCKELVVDNITLNANIINISNGGLLFVLNNVTNQISNIVDTKIEIGSLQIRGKLFFEPFLNAYRIVFSSNLSQEALRSIIIFWNEQLETDLIKVFEVITSDSYHNSEKNSVKKV